MPIANTPPSRFADPVGKDLLDLADALPVLVSYLDICDGEVRYAFANRLYERWFPHRREEIQGRLVREVVGEAAYAAVRHQVERALAGERLSFEQFMPYADGAHRYIRVEYVPRTEAGKVVGIYALVQDISEAKLAETALRELNETLEAQVAARTAERDRAWRNARDLQVVVGADGVFHTASPAWFSILGLHPEEVNGHHFRDFIVPEDAARTQAALADAVAARDLTNFENRYRHKDGTVRWISWNTSMEGELVYASGRDITADRMQQAALRMAEDRLRQSQKLEAVGQLTGGVAHDFNNLLTIIRSSVDFLGRPGLPEERRQRYVNAIAETVERATKLTGQLLAFARRQPLMPTLFDPVARLRAIADMLRTVVGARVRLETDFAAGPLLVHADASQFETAVVNMVVNARDAMGGEGRLAISVFETTATPAADGDGGRFVAVRLADTGIGIPAGNLAQIFEPFFTTKEVGKGTGLGLSQVYGFAKQSGGDVSVESEAGSGTTFTLYLPRAEGEALVQAEAAEDAGPVDEGQGRRVLLVEDNAEVGAFSQRLLQDLGYETAWATNAGEALGLLEAEPDGFDAVFSDVVMPGATGIELGEEIRRSYPGLPVVLTSGYSHVLAAEGPHGFDLLQKPYAAEELSRALRDATRRGRG